MPRARVLERLSASDLFRLMWDDYGWCSDVGVLAVLDGTGVLAARAHADPVDRLASEARPRKGATHVPAGLV